MDIVDIENTEHLNTEHRTPNIIERTYKYDTGTVL